MGLKHSLGLMDGGTGMGDDTHSCTVMQCIWGLSLELGRAIEKKRAALRCLSPFSPASSPSCPNLKNHHKHYKIPNELAKHRQKNGLIQVFLTDDENISQRQ